MKKRSIDIAGHRTSVSLEDGFWSALMALSQIERRPVNIVIAEIDSKRTPNDNLSSAIRLHVLAAARAGLLPSQQSQSEIEAQSTRTSEGGSHLSS